MSGYIFQGFVKDFSGRTRQNMKVIDAIYDEHSDDPDKKVYEVTQVINSLFGMVIVPYEKYKNQYGLHKDDIENEILRMSNTATVKEYASRVRAETALHLHSRSKQAEKYGIENGATKIKEAAELGGKTAKDLYKEIGGREDYDKIVGRSKKDVHKQKVEEAKKRRLEERKQKELELQSGAKSRNGKSK